MSYISQDGRYYKVDTQRFARDLCKAMGGTNLQGEYAMARFMVGTEQIWVHGDDWKKRVNIGVSAPDVAHGDRNLYNGDHKTAEASFNPDRPIERLAKEVRTRVIEASKDALAKQRAYAAEQIARREGIAADAAKLQAEMPNITVRVNDSDKQSATIWAKGDIHLSARLNVGGTVYIDRIGSVSVEKFKKIMAILEE